MLDSEKKFLAVFGWDEYFASPQDSGISSSLFRARVIGEERNLYRVQITLNEVRLAAISGAMQFSAKSRADYPAVGDWVFVELSDQDGRATIHHIAPRKTLLQRKQVASEDMQILSTNVDYVFITTSVNDDLNISRLERYLSVAMEAGSTPVILLTKSDLGGDQIFSIVAKVQAAFPGVLVRALSKNEFEKEEFFSDYLKTGKTSVFIGSSGVGKSTLVNFLTGEDQAKTQDIREKDSKGRHTTTSRNLYISRYGGLIIDTPGMREIQLSDQAEEVQIDFSDVEELIAACRFSDCRHQADPGCAINKALESGTLLAERWKNYQASEAKILAAENKKLAKNKKSDSQYQRRSKK